MEGIDIDEVVGLTAEQLLLNASTGSTDIPAGDLPVNPILPNPDAENVGNNTQDPAINPIPVQALQTIKVALEQVVDQLKGFRSEIDELKRASALPAGGTPLAAGGGNPNYQQQNRSFQMPQSQPGANTPMDRRVRFEGFFPSPGNNSTGYAEVYPDAARIQYKTVDQYEAGFMGDTPSFRGFDSAIRGMSPFQSYGPAMMPGATQSVYVTVDHRDRKLIDVKDLSSVYALLNQFNQITATSHSVVHLRSLLSPATALRLAAVSEMAFGGRRYEDIYQSGVLMLTDRQIKFLLFFLVRPVSRDDFIFKLSSALKFPTLPPNYSPTISNFEIFYNAMLEYNRTFTELVNILTETVTVESQRFLLPEISIKDNPMGYARIYVSAVPFKLAEVLAGKLITKDRKWSDFKDMTSFTREYMDLLQGINNRFKEVVILGRSHQIPIDSSSPAATSVVPVARTAVSNSGRSSPFRRPNSSFSTPSRPSGDSRSRYGSSNQSLRFVSGEAYDAYNDSDEYFSQDNPMGSSDIAEFYDEDEEDENENLDEARFIDGEIARLSAVRSASDPRTLPCYEMTRTGVCQRPECKYSHDERVIGQAILRRLEELQGNPIFKAMNLKIIYPSGVRSVSADSSFQRSGRQQHPGAASHPPRPVPPHAIRPRQPVVSSIVPVPSSAVEEIDSSTT